MAGARCRPQSDCGRVACKELGAFQLKTDGFDAGANHSDSGDDGGGALRATYARLSSFRARALLHRSIRGSPLPVLDDLHFGFLYSHTREPEVSWAFRDGALFCQYTRIARIGFAALPLPLWPVSSLHVFRHERLWTVRRFAALVSALLVHRRYCSRLLPTLYG